RAADSVRCRGRCARRDRRRHDACDRAVRPGRHARGRAPDALPPHARGSVAEGHGRRRDRRRRRVRTSLRRPGRPRRRTARGVAPVGRRRGNRGRRGRPRIGGRRGCRALPPGGTGAADGVAPMSAAPEIVSLSLVSHTNAGKTTLARTLLGRDIGEVRDAPHVTEFADAHVLVETSRGDRLLLWDTPGFGDSVRLVRRLRQAEHPVGRFLSEAWDRWRDRPFWASQQAVRNTRDEADVLLYLVNASESVEAAGYVQPEMELLGWIGKPVVVLVNQLGAPRGGDVEGAEVASWRASVSAYPHVRAVLPLDAFARCWVQELTLFTAVEAALPEAKREAMARLRDAWRAHRLATFDSAVQTIAASLARIATMSETLPDAGGVRARLRQAGAAIGIGSAEPGPAAAAQQSLAARLDDEVRAN